MRGVSLYGALSHTCMNLYECVKSDRIPPNPQLIEIIGTTGIGVLLCDGRSSCSHFSSEITWGTREGWIKCYSQVIRRL